MVDTDFNGEDVLISTQHDSICIQLDEVETLYYKLWAIMNEIEDKKNEGTNP